MMISEVKFKKITHHIFKRESVIKAVEDCYFKKSTIKDAEIKNRLAKNTLRKSYLKFESELKYLNLIN